MEGPITIYCRAQLPLGNLATLSQEPFTPLLPAPPRRSLRTQTLFHFAHFDRGNSSGRSAGQIEGRIRKGRTVGTKVEVSS